MYNCRYCGKECKNGNSLRNHERLCKMSPHYNAAKFKCRFCGRSSPTKDGNSRHEIMCKLNPNRHVYTHPWNKGLTKETDERVLNNSNHISDCFKATKGAFTGRTHTEESKKLISLGMMGNHNNDPSKTGRGKKGWYKGFYCSSSYELAFIIYCLDHSIPIKRCNLTYDYEYNGEHHKYYPDFIVDGTIIEIKGYYTDIVKVKAEAVHDRPIRVLYKEDLIEVFKYVETTYNKLVDKNIDELYEKDK